MVDQILSSPTNFFKKKFHETRRRREKKKKSKPSRIILYNSYKSITKFNIMLKFQQYSNANNICGPNKLIKD